MAQLTNPRGAGVFTPDEVPSERVPSLAMKTAFCTYSTHGWAIYEQQVGDQSLGWQAPKNTKIY